MLNPEIAVNLRPVDRVSRNAALTALAKTVQPAIAKAVASLPPVVRDFLHGTLIGHPFHPVITDIPIGAWTVTAVLDTIELGGGPAIAGADAALAVGLAGAVGAIVSGWADWSDTTDDPRNLGLLHAALNGTAFSAYIVSLALRRSERRQAGLIVGLAAYAFVGAGGYLGGEISYGQQIGPKHTAEPLTPAPEFTPVLATDALADKPLRVDFGGIPVLLSRTPDGVAAISAICTHRGAPLDEGTFADGCVTCPWHASVFDLADGSVRQGPASFPQPRFDARINGDRIEVRALIV